MCLMNRESISCWTFVNSIVIGKGCLLLCVTYKTNKSSYSVRVQIQSWSHYLTSKRTLALFKLQISLLKIMQMKVLEHYSLLKSRSTMNNIKNGTWDGLKHHNWLMVEMKPLLRLTVRLRKIWTWLDRQL